MSAKSFFLSLLLVTALVTMVLGALLYFLPLFAPYTSVTFGSIILFVLISVLLFFLGKSSVGSKNKQLFNGIITSSVFIKMVLSLAFLLVYKKVASPKDGYFTILFLIAYATYTAYEVWFMLRLAKEG